MRILFVGDLMPGGVLPYQDKYVEQEVLDYLKTFDLRVGTLESAIGTDIPYDKVKMSKTMGIVYARDEDLFRLVELGFDVVSLANNHIGDLGEDGLLNTISQLDRIGIRHCGAGKNIDEAKKPVYVDDNGIRIAIMGCMVNYPKPVIYHIADASTPGVYQVSLNELVEEVARVSQTCDKLILMPHWCEEHKLLPPAFFKKAARRLVDAGADCIIGSHPHLANPVYKYHRADTYFSLGNFLFPDKCMNVPRPTYYPDPDEFSRLKRVWTYPYRIKHPVVAVWKPQNRIGMMVDMEIGKHIKTEYKLCCLSSENVLGLYSSALYRLRLAWLAFVMKLPYYKYIRKIYLSRFNLIRHVVDRMPFFCIDVKL